MPDARRTAAAGGLVLAAAAIGAFARGYALGAHPLAVDEYYFAVAIEGWLAHGLPELPGGGFYTRGAPAQLLSAASAALLGPTEAAFRLPVALCGLAAAWLTWRYARRHLAPELACLAACFVLLSSWEIEFSRFARMYVLLQCLVLALATSGGRELTRARSAIVATYVLTALALVTHSLSVVLLPVLAVPLAARMRTGLRRSVPELLAFGAIALLALVVVNDPFRTAGVVDAWPEGFASAGGSRLRGPGTPFWTLGTGATPDLVLLVLALGAAAGAAAFRWRRDAAEAADRALAACAVVAAGLHALALAALFGAFFIVRRGRRLRLPQDRWARTALAGAVGIALAWVAYGLVRPEILLAREPDGASLAGAFRRTFFGLPDYYQALVVPWSREMPWMGALLAIGVAVQALRAARGPWPAAVWSPGILAAWVATALSLLTAPYPTTRYTFFVYPVALVAAIMTARDATAWAAGRLGTMRFTAGRLAAAPVAVCAALALTVEDCQPTHPFRVATPEVGLRMGAWERFALTWYPRWDFRSPGEFLEERAEPGRDTVLVAGLPPVSYYLGKEHAVYYARDDRRFANVSRERGTRDVWSGRPLVSTPAEIAALAEKAQRLWLVRAAGDTGLDPVLRDALGTCAPPAVAHRSVDGRIEVVVLALPCGGPAGWKRGAPGIAPAVPAHPEGSGARGAGTP